MRGLVANPKGEIIPRPIKSNFREGLSVLEYFISTHGARKGLADTALRTADSGYLTRRLCDVAQDVIIREEDCGTDRGLTLKIAAKDSTGTLVRDDHVETSLFGRNLAEDISAAGKVILTAGTDLGDRNIDTLVAAGVEEVKVRSVLTCDSKVGQCAMCYGRSTPVVLNYLVKLKLPMVYLVYKSCLRLELQRVLRQLLKQLERFHS
jgi:DNA-directed RNA polymerase subunit beta'